MKFSVIIPTYKTSNDMLIRSIESVRNQTTQNYEIIIVDDNPAESAWKDNIKKLSKENTSKDIQWIFHEDNKGANAARNTGVKASKGEIVAFLDSDDEWKENYLEKVEKCYLDDSVVITASEVIRIFPDRMAITYKPYKDGYIYDQLLYKDIVGTTSSVTVKKEVVMDAGLFDENLPARQDYDMWIRVCRLGNIKYIHEPLVKLHCDDHVRISAGISNHERGTLMVLEKLINQPQLREYSDELTYAHKLYLGEKCLREDEFKKARIYFSQCMKIKKKIKVYMEYCASYFPFVLKLYRRHARVSNNKKAVASLEEC